MASRSEIAAKKRNPVLRQIKYWKKQGLTLEQTAAKIGRSFYSVRNLWNKYLATPKEKDDFDEDNSKSVDCITKIVNLAKKHDQKNQPYLFFVKNYGVRASTALKICEQLRG